MLALKKSPNPSRIERFNDIKVTAGIPHAMMWTEEINSLCRSGLIFKKSRMIHLAEIKTRRAKARLIARIIVCAERIKEYVGDSLACAFS